ncbi:LmbU family transcriptional regulator [Actinomadura sp. DC4]|uniref:LmbU family transcriptional regulator n=1 Tax=Actinomadura sp. DC4 TaxID=3055069 RepID=UPI0025AFEBF8|nr:LmbU family transcriptional regulator [Actinomadura sp. DC4]MDN3360147.1 LmbU family transcriptional regulator [Actinomadura sp. DC4]
MSEATAQIRNIAHRPKNNRPVVAGLTGLALTRQTSLSLKASLPLDDWLRVGLHIVRISDSSTWWLADWLIYGRELYPDRYIKAIEDTALDYQTLRNYAWVAGRVSAHRRRANLSFQHHAEVAARPEDEQDKWLQEAEEHGWSRNRLRTEMRLASRSGRSEPKQQVNFRIDDEHVRLWQEAASMEKQDLHEWMVEVLNKAASLTRERPPATIAAS